VGDAPAASYRPGTGALTQCATADVGRVVVASTQGIPSEAGGRADELTTAFVEATEALLCVVDGAGRILLANPALQRFTGRSAEQLLGSFFWDVYVVPDERDLARDAVTRAMASGIAAPQEGDWITADGERRRVSMRNTVLRDDAGVPYAIGCVGVDVTEDRRREAQLHLRAQTDLLTGLANRGALFDALRARLVEGGGCALLFCDLDGFKGINDEHGHSVGDRMLAEVALRLAEVAGPGELVSRLGGDEFVVLCAGRPDEDLDALAERVVERIRAPFPGPKGPMSIGVSVGIAVSRPGDTADDLIGRADRAMYGVKSHPHRTAGRDRRTGEPAG
jgi:diguanylate cyclase (GGDEF)-like protein/PAS domain S-box-containing protein